MSNDLWRTPPSVFKELDEEFWFMVDLAANANSALKDHWYGPDNPDPARRDAFLHEWELTSFCNPPYSNRHGGILRWIQKARRDSLRHDSTIVLLVPPSMATHYMRLAIEQADEVRMFSSRLSFLREDGAPVRGNRGDSCLVVFRGRQRAQHRGGARVFYVDDPTPKLRALRRQPRVGPTQPPLPAPGPPPAPATPLSLDAGRTGSEQPEPLPLRAPDPASDPA